MQLKTEILTLKELAEHDLQYTLHMEWPGVLVFQRSTHTHTCNGVDDKGGVIMESILLQLIQRNPYLFKNLWIDSTTFFLTFYITHIFVINDYVRDRLYQNEGYALT